MTHSATRAQLEDCFAIVFPDLSPEEISAATMQSVSQWDSLAMLTLVSVIEESCAVRIDLDDLPNLVSFEKLATYLESTADTDKSAA
jgi:acyl carrier protein